jgi:transposase-like protein
MIDNEQVRCPKCHGTRIYKSGFNTLKNGEKKQKYYCPECDKSFQVR